MGCSCLPVLYSCAYSCIHVYVTTTKHSHYNLQIETNFNIVILVHNKSLLHCVSHLFSILGDPFFFSVIKTIQVSRFMHMQILFLVFG